MARKKRKARKAPKRKKARKSTKRRKKSSGKNAWSAKKIAAYGRAKKKLIKAFAAKGDSGKVTVTVK